MPTFNQLLSNDLLGVPDAEFARSVITETTDAAGNTATSYSMTTGQDFVGSIGTNGDRDWVEIQLTAGETYTFSLTGVGLADPYLYLHNASGTLIAQDDDDGGGRDSLLTYTATNSGTYYLDARAFPNSGTGSYVLAADVVVPATMTELAAYLTDGYWEATSRSRRSFDTSTDNVIDVNITALTAAGQRLARHALDAWEMVADLQFNYVTSGGEITFDDSASGAFSTSSVSGGTILSSTVNVETSWVSTYGTTLDGYSFQTYIHEIGHALGLGHQGIYNGTAIYGSDNVFLNDSWNASIMSYFNQSENTSVDASFAWIIGPMRADIIAMQDLYGASTGGGDIDTTGATTWGVNSNLGGYMGVLSDVLGGTSRANFFSGSAVSYTLCDAGGTDTWDVSYSNRTDRIDMGEGTTSNIGGLIGNVGIALGTLIENLIAGDGTNRIFGNQVANEIQANGGADIVRAGNGDDVVYGGTGDDTLYGGAGLDVIAGGTGNDTAYGGDDDDRILGHGGRDILHGDDGNDILRGGTDADRLFGDVGDDTLAGQGGGDRLFGNVGIDTIRGGSGDDVVFGGRDDDQVFGNLGNDRLIGQDGADTVYGGVGRDTLIGGAGNDTLDGQGGADSLTGGADDDILTGGAGLDTFIFRVGDGNDVVTDFTDDLDTLQLQEALWGGGLTERQVVNQFASVVGSDIFFDFGTDLTITLTGFTSLAALRDDIVFF